MKTSPSNIAGADVINGDKSLETPTTNDKCIWIYYNILRNPLVPAIKFNIVYLFHGMILDLYSNSSELSMLSYHQLQARL